jgi:bacterial/archaeal transporter family-2 protein
MTSTLALVVLAIIAGLAVALQGQFMGTIDRQTGTLTSVLITYGVGSTLAVILWLAGRGSFQRVDQIPWYSWSAGAFGLVIVGAIGYTAPRLGLSRTLVIAVAAQLLAAVVIDHFGLFTATPRPVDLTRVAGVVLAFAGVWLVVRG